MQRLALAATLIALATAACGGADVPEHNGYKSAKSRPWQSPTVLELDEGLEAEVDDAVSYPKRQRARWYAVDLPGSGALEIQVTVASLTDDRETDLAFEVMDEGYQVLTKADRDEDDAGDEQKMRTLKALVPGRYYIHVYAQRRLDEADFTLQIAFRAGDVVGGPDEGSSDFPRSVAFIGALPDVPAVDDAPVNAPPPAVVKKCKGKSCKKPVVVKQPPRAIQARIAGIVSVTAGGTLIRIDRGAQQGIKAGWKGSVVSRDGKAIPGGTFEVSRVSAGEAFGTVRATADAVTQAKYVRLRPP